MNQISIIPELNYWMRKELSNASVYDTYHKIPVEVSDSWREPRSVIELLFNETFDPGAVGSSSAGIESENDKPYIYLYRRVNLLNITDKVILNRIQVYRWWANVYAANSLNFIDMFNMQGSNLDPTDYTNEVTLPYDVDEEDRSDYITYQNYNGSFTNYPLWQLGGDAIIETPEHPAIIATPDIFDFTDLTFEMLDKLWFYKMGCPWVTLEDVLYSDLDSALARLIYVYLDAFLNDSYTYYSAATSLADSSDILSSLYEKHVLDMLYLLRQKMYGIIWRDKEVISNRIEEINENFFMILKKEVSRVRVDEDVLENNQFLITGDRLPWDRRDFTFFKDGEILEQDQDYTVVVNTDDPTNVYVQVLLLRDDFEMDELVEFIWSYADPYSLSEIDS
jgi:hypothetical protein